MTSCHFETEVICLATAIWGSKNNMGHLRSPKKNSFGTEKLIKSMLRQRHLNSTLTLPSHMISWPPNKNKDTQSYDMMTLTFHVTSLNPFLVARMEAWPCRGPTETLLVACGGLIDSLFHLHRHIKVRLSWLSHAATIATVLKPSGP